MEVGKMIFLSKWVLYRFQPLIFQGVPQIGLAIFHALVPQPGSPPIPGSSCHSHNAWLQKLWKPTWNNKQNHSKNMYHNPTIYVECFQTSKSIYLWHIGSPGDGWSNNTRYTCTSHSYTQLNMPRVRGAQVLYQILVRRNLPKLQINRRGSFAANSWQPHFSWMDAILLLGMHHVDVLVFFSALLQASQRKNVFWYELSCVVSCHWSVAEHWILHIIAVLWVCLHGDQRVW